jgi:hypothetical protein
MDKLSATYNLPTLYHQEIDNMSCVETESVTKTSLNVNGEQESKTGPVWGLVAVGRGGYNERANVVEILCTHI